MRRAMEAHFIETEASQHRATDRKAVDETHLDREQISAGRGDASVWRSELLIDVDRQRVPGRGEIQKLLLRNHVRPGPQGGAGAYVLIENIVHRPFVSC